MSASISDMDDDPSRRARLQLAIAVILSLATTAWLIRNAVARGQDWSFDTVSYHAIYPLEILRGSASVGRSQLAAGAFFNPMLDAPFAWGVRHLDPKIVTALLVIVQSAVVAIVATVTANLADRHGFIPRRMAGRLAGRSAVGPLCFAGAWVLAARLALGGLASVQLGAGFGDLTSALPAAVGLAIAIRAIHTATTSSGGIRSVFAAAFLFGISVGLKLSNAAHAIAFVAAIAAVAGTCRWSRRRVLGRAVAGLGAGWLVAAGPWALRMALRYGNPLFPFAVGPLRSSWLRRADGTDLDLSVTRFPVRTLRDLVLLPLRVARGGTSISELRLRDPRWLLCVISVLLGAAVLVTSRLRHRSTVGDRTGLDRRPDAAALFVLVFWALSFAVWAVAFGNGRYGVLLEVMTPLVVLSAAVLAFRRGSEWRLHTTDRRRWSVVAAVPLVVAVVLTGAVTARTSFADWNHVTFGRRWFDFDTAAVPDLRQSMLVAATDLEPLNLGLVVLRPKAFAHLSAALLPTRLGKQEIERIHRFPGRLYVILGGLPGTDELTAAGLSTSTTCWPLPARQGFSYRVCELEVVG